MKSKFLKKSLEIFIILFMDAYKIKQNHFLKNIKENNSTNNNLLILINKESKLLIF